MPSLTSARRSASPSPAASGTTGPAVPNVVDASRLPFHVKAYYLALRQFVKGVESVGPETLDLLGVYAAAAGDQRTQLDAALAELTEARERARTLERREIALERRVAERDAEHRVTRRSETRSVAATKPSAAGSRGTR